MTPVADVVFEALGDEGVLYKLSTEKFFGLNETSARIWSLAVRGGGVDEICSALTEEFDVSPEVARSHTAAFLELLVAHGLAVPASD